MMVVLSHPTGNANVKAAAIGLLNAGILAQYHTTIAIFPGTYLEALSSVKPLAELKRRSLDVRLQKVTRQQPVFELGRIFSSKAKLRSLNQHEKGVFSIDAVYRNLDKKVARLLTSPKTQADAIYAYEDGAEYSFRQAKLNGQSCLYDLPIGYWRSMRKLLSEEIALRPEWADTITGFKDSEQKLNRKDEELKLADHIFVASSFTKYTLQQYPHQLSEVSVIPYGFPPVTGSKVYEPLQRRKLKLLFVGSLSQRKGIANLFEAVAHFDTQLELTIVGNKPVENCEALNAALEKHTWIRSLPHQDILSLMRTSDVFVFPSLFEGFGLVITEAMSQGTPVITTERTAGPDVITDGENGWLVKAGDTDALIGKIQELLNSPDSIEKAGRAALQAAASRPWDVYGKELAQKVIDYTETRNGVQPANV